VPMRFGAHLHGQGRAAATTTAGAHLRRQGRAVATTTAQLMMLVASVVGAEGTSPKILLRNEQGMECSVELTAEGHLLSSCPIAAPSLNVSALEERLARIESALDSHNRLEGFVPPPSPPMPPGPPLPPSPPSTPSTPTTLRWNARSDWSVSNGGLTVSDDCSGNNEKTWGASSKAWGSGKWYIELTLDGLTSIAGVSNSAGGSTMGLYYQGCTPSCLCCDGAAGRPSYGAGRWSDGDVLGIAVDLQTAPKGSVQFYLNNVGYGLAPANYMDLTSGSWTVFTMDHTGGGNCNQLSINSLPVYAIPEGFSW